MKVNFWKIGTFVLIAILVCGSLLYLFGQKFIPKVAGILSAMLFNKPQTTVKDFNKKLCDADIEGAQKLMSATVTLPPDWLKVGLSAGAKECKENDGLKDIIISEEKIENEKASVIGETQYNNGKTSKFAMKLYLEKGEWRIAYTPPK